MKTNRSFAFQCLAAMTVLLLADDLIAGGLNTAPLVWYPGPSLDAPVSGAATTLINGGNNLLIGGDASYYFEGFAQSLSATNEYWSYLPALSSSATIALGVAGGGDPIVVYGGTDGTNATSAVYGYSPSGDGQTTLASMTVPRAYLGYAADSGGNAYAIGGLDDNGQPLASVERYNSGANKWTNIASLPAALFNFPAVFDHTNQIYIFGGSTNLAAGSETASVLRYSTKNKTWTAVAPMPVPVAGSAAALAAGGNIYVVGGVSGGVTVSLVQVYNLASNSWSLATPLPEALSGSAMGVDSLGRLIVMGGMDVNGNDVSDVWRSQLLASPDTAPVFTQYPTTNAIYNSPYSSSIAATGNPQPTYLVTSGPATLQVDMFTGVITWTPEAANIGTNLVTIRATNYAGFVDYSFAIVVPNPPPSVLSNLAVVGVTDTSVTLSWDPEDPVVGAVTYTAYLRHVIHDAKGSGATVWYTQIGSSTTLPMMTISGIAPGLSQAYYIVATGPGGSSGYTSAIAATTTAPQGPPDLFVTGVTSTSVSFAWDAAPGPAQNAIYSPVTSYTIMERNVSVYPAVNIPTVTGITGTTATVTGLTPGKSHIWFVSGVDAQGTSSAFAYPYAVITNPVPVAARLSSPTVTAGGGLQFTATQGGTALQTISIQATTNLADPSSWMQIGSLLPTSNPTTFTDTNAAQYPSRFYRAVVQ